MQVFYAGEFSLALPLGHRLPMEKYRLLHAALLGSNDQRLRFRAAPALAREHLRQFHAPTYVDNVFDGRLTANELRKLGLPWSPALVVRAQRSVGATLAAVDAALAEGVAASLAGGSHHAAYDYGAGFCVFNDVAVAALAALRSERAKRILVVDCDVHQGDGTATMLAACANAFTFSIHCARNYPQNKAHSDLDIALADGIGDDVYMRELERGLARALALSRPDLALVIAGADVYASDRLGRLNLSQAGIAQRDRLVFAALERCAAAVVVVMGGGYADNIEEIVAIHQQTVMAAADSWLQRGAHQRPGSDVEGA